jgi:hypothetical protein
VTDSLFLSEKKGPVVDQGGLETRRPFLGRTEGSNLVSSSGESCRNSVGDYISRRNITKATAQTSHRPAGITIERYKT